MARRGTKVRQAADGDRLIENEVVNIGGIDYDRQVTLTPESDVHLAVLAGAVVSERVAVTIARSTTAVRSSVAASTSDQLLLAANAVRLGVVFYNDSDSPLYIGLGTAPTTSTDFSFLIGGRSEFLLPLNFIGEIRGTWQVATGSARITELTT